MTAWCTTQPAHACTWACTRRRLPPPAAHPIHDTGMRVTAVPGGQEGRIEGGFGKTGKFRVRFPGGAPQLHSGSAGAPSARVLLRFKRFLFDPDKRRMAQ